MKVEMTLDEARSKASRLRNRIKGILPDVRCEFAGSLRRQEKTVGDLDLLIETPKLAELQKVRGVSSFMGGNERACFDFDGVQVDVWRVPKNCWGSMLFHVTGPKGYFIAYALRAKSRGMFLGPKGLYRGMDLIAASTEEDIYEALGKKWVYPHLRGKG